MKDNDGSKPLISVVVPVYNVEKYIGRCVDSILAQTFPNFEILLVDDGSKDGSGAICDKYKDNDSRVKVFHKENGGVTSARKYGVDNASGQYITFIDSDDYIPENYISKLYDLTDNDKYDIVICNAKCDSIVDIVQARKYSISGKMILNAPWGRLIKRELFDDSILDIPRSVVVGEDMLMNIRLAFRTIKPFRIVTDKWYCYEPNSSGTMSNFRVNVAYEEMYYSYLIASIPSSMQKDYLKEIIENRLNALQLLAFSSWKDLSWRRSPLFTKLVECIKETNYQTNSIQRKLLYFSDLGVKLYILSKIIIERLKYLLNRQT